MERLLPQDVADSIKGYIASMQNKVKMVLFTQEGICETCKETKLLLQEVAELNSLITVEFKDIKKDADLAEKYNITLTPSFVMLNDKDEYLGVKFNGIPAGHEINSFLNGLLIMSGVAFDFDEATIKRIKAIDKKVDIKVFVTLSCPHCPGAVETAHKIAMLNPNVEASMIEAQTFGALSAKFKVSGVPKIIINDQFELLGNQPVEAFLKELENLR
ncbi:MAG: protein disulfide oxidoreductase [Candidatus Izemoplasmataceae bacterium]|uniref:protein disulfide oxidoreductase n=1 Tax=Liberiplasma polymorphum TaxID=3374570 RepID=UPI003773B069